MIKVSVGTADVLGLKRLKTDAPPTTAYLLSGDKCLHDCAFCPQARNSSGRADMLSRIIWPEYQMCGVAKSIGEAYEKKTLKRTCLQVVNNRESLAKAIELMNDIKQEAEIPVCVSCNLTDPKEAVELVAKGADRIGLSLDAACERIYREAKGDSWSKRLRLIEEAANMLPGKISTHLIVGLGETEEEMADMMAYMVSLGVTVGLFAFTPVKGTRYQDRKPPHLGQYRRMQTALFLLEHKHVDRDQLKFNEGRLTSFGLSDGELGRLLNDGKAFETSGCPDCNRPYYNEKPGGAMYNYPRALTENEVAEALALLGIVKERLKCSGV
ncbi:MAG: radical SAM protein [Bacillota bacterium]|nr:radical SAM protein [Bacillota bacterium]